MNSNSVASVAVRERMHACTHSATCARVALCVVVREIVCNACLSDWFPETFSCNMDVSECSRVD